MRRPPDGPIRRSRLLELIPESELVRDYRPVLTGVYARKSLQLDFALRSKALAVAFPNGVLGGWSAAALHGYGYIPDDAVPEIVLPARASRRAGVRFRHDRLAPGDSADVAGFDLTTHARTAFDLGRRLPFDAAVAAVDGLCYLAIAEPAGLVAEVAARHPGARGLKQLRAVLDLADGGAASPWETRTRLVLVRAGLPRPQTQFRLVGEHHRLTVFDLAWPQYRVAVEYDGEHHRTKERHLRGERSDGTCRCDVRRDLAPRDGWDVITATAQMVTRYPDELCTRVGQALRDRGWDARSLF